MSALRKLEIAAPHVLNWPPEPEVMINYVRNCARQFAGIGGAPVVALVTSDPAPFGANTVIDITDANSGVDFNSIVITLEGAGAFAAGVFSAGFQGSSSGFATITDGFRITIDPETEFAFSQVVDIVVIVEDQAGNPSA